MALSKPTIIQLLTCGYFVSKTNTGFFCLTKGGVIPRFIDDQLVEELVSEGILREIRSEPLTYIHQNFRQLFKDKPGAKSIRKNPLPWTHETLRESWATEGSITQQLADEYHESLKSIGRVVPRVALRVVPMEDAA